MTRYAIVAPTLVAPTLVAPTLVAFALAASLSLATACAEAATPINQTRPLRADGKLTVENIKGRITVSGWDRDEVEITGSLGEGTEGLQIEGDAGSLRVAVKYPQTNSWFGGWYGKNTSGESVLEIKAPAAVVLKVEGVAAEIEVRGVRGRSLEIDSVSGDVFVDAAPGEAEINSVSGDQQLTLNSADVTAESVSGDMKLGGDLRGRIELEAVSGNITLDSAAAASSVSAGVVSGDVQLRIALQPGARLSAESLSGDLDVIIPATTSARVTASSFTGRIRSFAGKVQSEEHGPGSSLETTLGNGDARIELETFSGDLSLRSD